MNSNKNNNKTHDYFRRRLRGLLKVTDYTRSDLARAMCVSYQTVLQWESGDKIPDVYQFREIANFFELPYEWFLDGTDGLPDTGEMADILGLSEDTVNRMAKLAEDAPDNVLDALDDAVFTLVTALAERGTA